MKSVKDAAGKLVCKVDAETKTVEIVRNGIKTRIRFAPDGSVETSSNRIVKTA
jgi:hypothetical protein